MDQRDSAGREQAGLLLTGGFVTSAALRDVYFARAFQAWSPLDVAALSFSLCTAAFLVVTLVTRPATLAPLARWPRDILAINVTSAMAWLAYFHALATLEPALVQVIWAGTGPLTIAALERAGIALAPPLRLRRAEGWCQAAVAAAVGFAAVVAMLGLSATAAGAAVPGVALALGSGAAIAVNTLLCKRLNERGVAPAALLSVRLAGVAAVALALAPFVRTGPSLWTSGAVGPVAAAALLLIVAPLYLNQAAIALASPMTVRVVVAAGPALVFLLQLGEGRLPPSPWSLAAIVVYSASAALAATARQWEVRAARRRARPAAAAV